MPVYTSDRKERNLMNLYERNIYSSFSSFLISTSKVLQHVCHLVANAALCCLMLTKLFTLASK